MKTYAEKVTIATVAFSESIRTLSVAIAYVYERTSDPAIRAVLEVALSQSTAKLNAAAAALADESAEPKGYVS